MFGFAGNTITKAFYVGFTLISWIWILSVVTGDILTGSNSSSCIFNDWMCAIYLFDYLVDSCI